MEDIFLFLHQFPQNLAGYLLTLRPKHIKAFTCNDGEVVQVYFTKTVLGCGVSLGDYIILDNDVYFEASNTDEWYYVNTVNHEHGHQKQSRMLGWSYLIVVGLISAVFNNLFDRIFHKNWNSTDKAKWYYSRFPEKWADELGSVERFKA